VAAFQQLTPLGVGSLGLHPGGRCGDHLTWTDPAVDASAAYVGELVDGSAGGVDVS
jgi:hypothetical protein